MSAGAVRKLRWSVIAATGESLHLASVNLAGGGGCALHEHDFYECFYVESGRGRQTFGDGDAELRAGELHFVRPEHGHGLGPRASGSLAFVNAAFEARAVETAMEWSPELREAWRDGSRPRVVALTPDQREGFLGQVERCAMAGRGPADALWFLLGLGRLLRPAAAGVAGGRLPDWLAAALPQAGEAENLRLGLAKLLSLCGRSHEHVARTFREALGMTATQWLNAERIRRARRLLETTRLSVLEVALECGFESPSHFHGRFRAAAGMTPLQYRRRNERLLAG